jgi:hypothetical protein
MLVALEVLDFALVLLRLFFRSEGAEVAAPACLGVHLACVEAVFPGCKFAIIESSLAISLCAPWLRRRRDLCKRLAGFHSLAPDSDVSFRRCERLSIAPLRGFCTAVFGPSLRQMPRRSRFQYLRLRGTAAGAER